MKLTAAEVGLYRNIIEETLLATDVCTIQTRTWTADDMGGGTWTYTAAATSVPCRLIPESLSMREDISGGKVAIHDMYVLYVHWDRSLDETMRVTFGGETFEVSHVDDVHTERLTRSANVVRVG